MKRASLILIAILAVLLVYPASMPSAKSPGRTDTPTITIITPFAGPGNGGPTLTGEDDNGDQDDIAGIKKGQRPSGDGGPSGLSGLPGVSMAKVWWMYFFSYARIMY